ncbi:MAG: AAA family ATPase, partial [Bdellovibrionales bacterium]|nr:AAA family ATPase [Bdellovibrionales bacterium]
GGYLTEAIRRRPYAVILFDEIEKAHPDVFNILLQVLDDGRLTDGQGRTVDFRNTVLIMTSNLGSQDILQGQLAGKKKDDIDAGVMKLLKEAFKPEFLNRLDDIIIFNPLEESEIQKIVSVQLKRLDERLAKLHLKLVLTKEAKVWLAKQGYDPVYGARPLKRTIQKSIEDPLSEKILDGDFNQNETIVVDVKNDQLSFEKTS